MKIYIERENNTKEVSLKKPTELNKILKSMDIPLESVILIKNGDICLEDEIVEDKDEVKLLSVVSGG